MKYLRKINEELKGKWAEETEIIYKDKNLVCLIPKSQMSSSAYGYKTAWCQTSVAGFRRWSFEENESNLLIRFLFKSGRKIRFTYFTDETFYWANETGHHVLPGSDNPFEVESERKKTSSIEQDILNLIETIPQECKDKVLQFIKKNLKVYQYIHRENEYLNNRTKMKFSVFYDIVNKFSEYFKKPYARSNFLYSNLKDEFLLKWIPDLAPVYHLGINVYLRLGCDISKSIPPRSAIRTAAKDAEFSVEIPITTAGKDSFPIDNKYWDDDKGYFSFESAQDFETAIEKVISHFNGKKQ